MARIALKRPPRQSRGGGDSKFPEPLPEGKYRATLQNFQEAGEAFGDAGKKYGGLAVDVDIMQGDFKGRRLEKLWVFPASEAAKSLVELLGGDPDDEEAEIDLEEAEGLEVNVYIGQRAGKKGGIFNTVKRFAVAPKK